MGNKSVFLLGNEKVATRAPPATSTIPEASYQKPRTMIRKPHTLVRKPCTMVRDHRTMVRKYRTMVPRLQPRPWNRALGTNRSKEPGANTAPCVRPLQAKRAGTSPVGAHLRVRPDALQAKGPPV
jgi:hypothetical protein